MPFRYRLQKIYELRERRLEEQKEAVVQAQERVREAEAVVQKIKNDIRLLQQNMLSAPHTLMQAHDDYIHNQYYQLDVAYVNLKAAQDDLEYEKQMLIKAQSDLEALAKHKEKCYEEYLEEEKKREMKMLDEVAGQRYFRQQAERLEEEMLEAAQWEADQREAEEYAAQMALQQAYSDAEDATR
jgi:flagellar FliJ protein